MLVRKCRAVYCVQIELTENKGSISVLEIEAVHCKGTFEQERVLLLKVEIRNSNILSLCSVSWACISIKKEFYPVDVTAIFASYCPNS